MSTPLPDCAAMAPLLAAFARGTKRSRLRQLVVVCPAGHTLIEVFPTQAGPYAVWRTMTVWGRGANGDPIMARQLAWLAAPLANLPSIGAEPAACRCTESAEVDGAFLSALLEAGTRRAVVGR